MSTLNSHNLDQIYNEILSQQKNAKLEINSLANMIMRLPVSDVSIPYTFGIKISFSTALRNYIRTLNSDKLFKSAAWHWISAKPITTLEDILCIQEKCFLDHLSKDEFTKKLKESLNELRRDYKSLENWILKRIALLDYIVDKRSAYFSESYIDLLTNLDIEQKRFCLTVATIAINEKIEKKYNNEIRDKAEKKLLSYLDGILKIAGKTVLSALGKDVETQDDSDINVNLMLPIIVNSESPTFFKEVTNSRYEEIKINAENAEILWGRMTSFRKILLLAFQSSASMNNHAVINDKTSGAAVTDSNLEGLKNNHGKKIGFWVPIDENIPGAPQAFVNKYGSTVIRNDLPEPEDLNNAISKTWLSYINQNIKEPAFISIPCVVSDTEEPNTREKKTIAVLNVDFNPKDEDLIYRGYHELWLINARKMVKPFILLAYHTYILLRILNPDKYKLQIDTGMKIWDEYGGMLDNFFQENKKQ